jgi:hypothetical protein
MFPIKPMPEINNFDQRANESRQQSASHKFISFGFGMLVRLWPADSRDWALAMQAELPQMESTQQSLQWLAGGIMSLGKAWWNHVVYGWNENEKEPSAVRTPGPVALTLAVIAIVAFFAMPSVHRGFRATTDSWRLYSDGNVAEYQRLTKEAEANHDAKMLAFLSPRMGSLNGNARLANEAVEMDPSLSWILIRGGNAWYVYNSVPQKYHWMQTLEASDPDNAVPYLSEAGVRQSEIWRQSNYQAPKESITNDSVWRTAMEKAFAASRYDTYYDRAMELQQSVLNAHNLRQPEDVVRGIVEYYPSGLGDAQKYSALLLDQAKVAQAKGDTATASRLGWSVAQFAERVRGNSHNEWARGTANAMLQSAYEFLQPLEAAAGHAEVVKMMAIEKDAYARRITGNQRIREPYFRRSLDATGIALHSAGLGVIAFGGMVIFAGLFLLSGRFVPALRTSTAYRWACNCGRYAPAGLIAAMALMAATFAPYLENVNDYLSGVRDAATLQNLTGIRESLYQIPSRVLNPMNYGVNRVYFWSTLLALTLIAAVLFISRNMFRRRAIGSKIA